MNKKLILGLILAVLAIGIPLTLYVMQTPQETRTRASGNTTLTFEPSSTQSNPIQKNSGDNVNLDISINPGGSNIGFVRFEVKFDPTKLTPDTNPFTLNQSVFSTIVEGPVVESGRIAASISVGADPTKVVTQTSKVGTINLKAINGTGGTPTKVEYGQLSQSLSTGSNEEFGQDTLSGTTPAYIAIGGGSTTPQPSPNPTGDPCGGLIPASDCPSVTPPVAGDTTVLNFDLLLHGIGAAGDNPNPSGNSLSNKNPLTPQRLMSIQIYNSSNQLVASEAGFVNYDSNAGSFRGGIDLGPDFPDGSYILKIQTGRYLKKLVPGIQSITALQNNNVKQIDLVAGDINGDNLLNVLDYNAFLNCGYGVLEPLPIADPNSLFNSSECQVFTPIGYVDLDDNGIVNNFDYNLFLRELSVQNGD